MQTLSFTPKLLRQRRFLSFLLPLFALFVGMGASQSVMAQVSTVATGNVSLTIRQAGATTTTNYDTQAGVAGPTNFFNKDFGTFNLATDAFVLNGGTITINEDPTELYDQGELLFRVFPGTLTTGTATAFTSLALVNNGLVGTTRTFSLSAANQNLLARAVTGSAAPGSSNRFEVKYRLTDNNVSGLTINTPIRKSVFTSVGSPVAPTNAGNSNVFINTTGTITPNITYGASSGATPLFNGANLGTYDINDGKLTLNGGNLTTFESGGDMVQGARLVYRVVKPAQGGNPAKIFPLSNIALVQLTATTDANGNTTRVYSASTALRNLISGLANFGTGNYNVLVSYEADVLTALGNPIILRDDNNGNNYVATFTTNGVPILTDTWTGNINDDWFNPGNWDLNITPTSNINVIVPDFGIGNKKPYPNIYSGVIFTASNGVSVDNTASGPAMSRNLEMQGSTQAQRSITRLLKGRLQVFGSFTNNFDSYIQASGTVIEFASSGNQTISGGTFVAIEMSGGGTKALTGVMTVTVSLTFLPNGGLMTTDISNPGGNYVTLGARSTDAPNGAQLVGETDATAIPSYIRGFVRTTRTNVLAEEKDAQGNPDPRTFGNIGLTLYFVGTFNPGDVDVTRNTAESYTPLVGPNGGTSRYGIRRIFGVRPSSRTGVVATLTFHYLDGELINLGPANPPVGVVPEPNLGLFVSQSGGNQFGLLGRDALDQVNNILTKTGVRVFATFTLGDLLNPLPVSLTGFDAKRIGADALVTWQTASEQNNKGFNVQVSADGKTYRNIGFVASETPNSTAPKAYTFTDTEKNKAGTRYYRLEQVDTNGKSTFFAPRVVTFEGKAAETSAGIVVYPNPLNNEILHLSLNSSVSGTAVVRILDMTGRQVGQRQLAINIGSNDVAVENMSELKSGLYILNVLLPSGEKKTMKVVKQ